MAGGPPVLSIGSLSALGFVLQPTFGTPVAVPANALNWIPQISNTLDYDTGQHLLDTGSGTEGSEQYGARGQSMVSGDVETYLFTSQCAALIAYFFGGTDTKAGAGPYTHSLARANSPSRLTFQDQWTAQAYQLLDVYLNTLTLTSSKTDWKVKFGVLGGQGDGAIASTVPTFDTTDINPLQWGDTSAATLFGSVTPGELESYDVTFSRNVQQFWGAGSYTPSQAAGGKFSIAGNLQYTFGSAAAAASYAAVAAGTEISLALTIGPITVNSVAGCQHVITLPNARIGKKPSKVYALDKLFMIKVPFLVRKPDSYTYVITNNYATAYI